MCTCVCVNICECVCVRSIACHCHCPCSTLKTIAGSFTHTQTHSICTASANGGCGACVPLQIGGYFKLVSGPVFWLSYYNNSSFFFDCFIFLHYFSLDYASCFVIYSFRIIYICICTHTFTYNHKHKLARCGRDVLVYISFSSYFTFKTNAAHTLCCAVA